MADEPNVTIITERGSSGGGWLMGLILLAVLVIGGIIALNYAGSNSAKNAAITNAANSVDKAAGEVGDAAKEASKKL